MAPMMTTTPVFTPVDDLDDLDNTLCLKSPLFKQDVDSIANVAIAGEQSPKTMIEEDGDDSF